MTLRNLFVFSLLVTPLLVLDARPRASRGAGSVSVDRETARGGSIEASGSRAGRFGQSSVDVEGANGGSYEADRQRAGRFGSSSVSAEGANGGSYDANSVRAGRVQAGSVNAQGVNGGSVSASGVRTAPYRNVPFRSGYVYTNGAYRSASIAVNTLYLAPVGVYAGWQILARPAFIAYPAFATLPVEVSVQVELKDRGFYGGPIDGDLGPATESAISRYQAANQLAVTGAINQALLVSLGITEAS